MKISGTNIIPLSPGKATVTITAAQRRRNYNAVSAKISISVRPLPVSSLSLKSSAKGQATASLEAGKSITSYQIQYSTASSMKSAKTITVKGTSKSGSSEKADQRQKILCSNPHSENSEQKELLLYLEQNSFRK
ncbi:MAG: hypothetical protein ACLUI0_12080 [Blautia massiliensis (ex Durand et al. 2017)]